MSPAGWSVEPREALLRFRYEGEEVAARFSATPGAMSAGEATVRAVFVDESGREFGAGDQVVAYAHIHERRLVRPATARVVALDVAVPPGIAVGYVDGSGDEVDTAIRRAGHPAHLLSPPTTWPLAICRGSRPSSPASARTRCVQTSARTTTA